MNEPRNNSFVSTVVFLCFTLIAICALTLLSEDSFINFAPTPLVQTQSQ